MDLARSSHLDRQGLSVVLRMLLAVVASVTLIAVGVAVTITPANAQTCSFNTSRIHPSGHQQRTDNLGGCDLVFARHFWVDQFGNTGDWTSWRSHPSSALSPYREFYSFGQGSGQT